MVGTRFRDNPVLGGGWRTEHLPGLWRGFGGREGPAGHGAAKTPWGTSHPAQGLRPPSFAGTTPGVPATLPCPRPPAPRPHAGPPALSGRRRAAAAGLGPLAGYCRRIYCIAACAGCSPAHNRLAVAQGSTLRGKEGGIHSDADCRAFAAVYCRIRPLAPAPPPPSSHPSPPRGALRGSCVPSPSPRCHPCQILWHGCLLWLRMPTQAVGHPTWPLVPMPGSPEGLRSPTVPRCCLGMLGPPLPGATAQSWCREEAGDCKQH